VCTERFKASRRFSGQFPRIHTHPLLRQACNLLLTILNSADIRRVVTADFACALPAMFLAAAVNHSVGGCSNPSEPSGPICTRQLLTMHGVRQMPGINASGRAGTVWSIRNFLVAGVSLLALFGIGVSGYVLRNASLERALASDAASVNETADMLLESAAQWARERGATNVALNAADPAPDGQKSAIANFRKLGDQLFEHALVRLTERRFGNKDQMIAGAKRAHEQLVTLRARADVEMARPARARKPSRRNGLRPSRRSSPQARLSVSPQQWRRTTSSPACPACRISSISFGS
jgi:hypothetical protein